MTHEQTLNEMVAYYSEDPENVGITARAREYRDLDLHVAEHLGAVWTHELAGPVEADADTLRWSIAATEVLADREDATGRVRTYDRLPYYSTSIAAAFRAACVMAMHSDPEWRVLRLVRESGRTRATFCTIRDDMWAEARGPYRTPRAICYALLRAPRRGDA